MKQPTEPRRLRIVTIDGTAYFVDVRLRELRRVDNPHERRPLSDIDLADGE